MHKNGLPCGFHAWQRADAKAERDDGVADDDLVGRGGEAEPPQRDDYELGVDVHARARRRWRAARGADVHYKNIHEITHMVTQVYPCKEYHGVLHAGKFRCLTRM